MKIKLIEMDKIKPYENNPRVNDETVEALKESISRYKYLVPIEVDEDYVIVTGHARYEALRRLGYDKAPCVVSDLTPAQAHEFRLVDNKVSEFASWDRDLLQQEIKTLSAPDRLSEFFEGAELDKLLKDLEFSGSGASEIDEDKVVSTEERLGGVFEQRVNDAYKDYITVVCPSCREEFYISRKALLQSHKFR